MARDKRKDADPRKYLLVFVLATVIFVCGFLVGMVASTQKLTDVQRLQETLRTDTLDIEIQYSMIKEDPCSFVNTTGLSEQLYDVALKLDYMEGLLGKDDPNVLRLKQYYSLLEIRQWLFERQLIEECAADKDLILYFYSNEPGVCTDCEEQGFILSYLRKKYNDQLLVYSFDFALESQAVAALRGRYGVTGAPTLVINDQKLEGFQRTSDIEHYLFTQIDEGLDDPLHQMFLNQSS